MSVNGTTGMEPEASTSGSPSVSRRGTRASGKLGANGVGGAEMASSVGTARSRSRQVVQPPREPVEFTPEVLEAERAALLVEKHSVLDRANDRHDDLVRELFHLRNFVTMVSYDPVIAKQEDTEVFNTFKSQFDLLEVTAPTTSTRQTRRKANERRQILASSSSISAPPVTAASPTKGKGKSKASNTDEIWNIIASTKVVKKREKAKKTDAVEDVMLEGDDAAVMSVDASAAPNFTSISTPDIEENGRGRRKPSRRKIDFEDKPPVQEPISSITVERRSSAKKRRRDDSPISVLPPVSPGKVLESIVVHPNGTMKENVHPPAHAEESISVSIARRGPVPPSKITKIKVRPPASDKAHFASDTSHCEPGDDGLMTLPSPSKLGVKRIKLIVRKPPPKFSNPKQRAPPAKFNNSLHNFLNSYTRVDEDEDAELEVLEQEAFEEAKLRETAAILRREGRFIPRPQDEDDVMEVDEITAYTTPQRTSKDLWDGVVESVISRYKTRPRRPLARQITHTIASKVQAHFDAVEAKKVKVKEVEERKLRNLAKAAMKMVIAEWKKAVFHIREKQRMEEEEEERRLGHAHLDAILDQSGQILETQQEDLTKGDGSLSRSRSGSVPDFYGGEEEETDADANEEDEEGDDDTDEDDGGGSSTDGDMDAADVGLSMLLGADSSSKAPTRSETPATTMSGIPDHDDEVSTSGLLLKSPSVHEEDFGIDSDAASEADLQDLMNASPETSPMRARPSSVRGSISPEGERQPEPAPAQDPARAKPASEERQAIGSQQAPLRGDTYDTSLPTTPNSLPLHVDQQPSEPPEQTQLGEPPIINSDAEGQMDEPPMHRRDEDTGIGPSTGDMFDNPEAEKGTGTEGHSPEQGPNQDDEDEDEDADEEEDIEIEIPEHLKPYAVTPVFWDLEKKVTPPVLLRGVLRPYQQSGLEWLASLHTNKLNGILADEMGLGKTIQTIALLAHLACDQGIWGPHLIVVPTSVLLNWEMEFKKFLPGFRILSYHGSTKRRKELRQGWNDRHHFNVCVTSYALASRDAHIFKRKAWYYMILDEAHMIKNFKSQRWNLLLMFRSYRRLLLTGTPLQNNLTELWALLQFLMSGSNFANLKEFGDWFSNPLEKAIEMGNAHDDDTLQRVSKLHTVLRPYLLRRLKRDVEKELPSKFEHLTLCPLSKRQRFLYDEFMSRAHTQDALQSGVYQKIANILMQLRKVCNHPDLFEVRPIVTSFAMTRSAIADYEITELLVRRKLFIEEDETVSLDVVGLRFIDQQNTSLLTAVETRRLDATAALPYFGESPGEAPPKDTRTIAGFRTYSAYFQRASIIARWAHTAYLNRLRCSRIPILSEECLSVVSRMTTPIIPFLHLDTRLNYMDNVDRVNKAVKPYTIRAQEMAGVINAFAFATPPAVALDLPRIALPGVSDVIHEQPRHFDEVLHPAAVKLQIAFPEPSLLQYDCGKLQKLATLLREKKAGGHRALIFTQMTRILDILEIFLNFHGYLYLRLDGSTKIEDRQYITERFNADPRIFCFISSSRSGGVGINLTGADTVIFYDSDFNPQMDRQCEDRAHRIGQIRDVHIYRFVSQFSVEEAMLRKANQKRSLDDLVIQQGEFDWRSLFSDESTSALTKALGDFEDTEDRLAAAAAAREETSLVGADEDDFDDMDGGGGMAEAAGEGPPGLEDEGVEEDQEEGGTVVDYMVMYVERDWDHFAELRL